MASDDEIEIHLDESELSNSRLASELRDYILEEEPGLIIRKVRDEASDQDFGATLALILATPSVIAVARGIARWVSRRGTSSLSFVRGETLIKVDNVSNKSAEELAEAMMKLVSDKS